VDLYACVNARCAAKLIKQGAPADRVEIIGAIVGAGFQSSLTSSRERASLLQGLNFDPDKPLILVAGGSEGIGPLDQIISMLMTIKDSDVDHQVVVLAGRDAGLKARCEQQAKNVQDRGRLRVLGWVHPEELPALFRAADLLISKMGTMFYEAVAAGLPIVALEPPPGAERAQYDLLGDWGVGRAVKTIDEMRGVIIDLLTHPEQTEEMRFNTRGRVKADGAAAVARSLLAAQPGSTARRSLTIERESMSYQLVK
jgi:UDP-N-acetylglucosamine:LPS N-acetylglucosamine transferase